MFFHYCNFNAGKRLMIFKSKSVTTVQNFHSFQEKMKETKLFDMEKEMSCNMCLNGNSRTMDFSDYQDFFPAIRLHDFSIFFLSYWRAVP